jgi:DNA-binding NarL/FixJ family response regulator
LKIINSRLAATPPTRQHKSRVSIMIADKEAIFRYGLMKLFGLEDDLRVVAQAENGQQVLALGKTFQPNMIMVQAEILSEGGGKLLTRIRQSLPQSKFIVVGTSFSEDESVRYVNGGASGVILKAADPALFVKCVRRVMDGEMWLPKRHVAKMAKALGEIDLSARRPADTLTPREKLIVSYLMVGCRNREIADTLSISEQTVKNHLRAIYDKVGVSDRLELVLYAIDRHLELPQIDDSLGNHPKSAVG